MPVRSGLSSVVTVETPPPRGGGALTLFLKSKTGREQEQSQTERRVSDANKGRQRISEEKTISMMKENDVGFVK